MRKLRPKILVPQHTRPIEGQDEISEILTAYRWFFFRAYKDDITLRFTLSGSSDITGHWCLLSYLLPYLLFYFLSYQSVWIHENYFQFIHTTIVLNFFWVFVTTKFGNFLAVKSQILIKFCIKTCSEKDLPVQRWHSTCTWSDSKIHEQRSVSWWNYQKSSPATLFGWTSIFTRILWYSRMEY